MSTPVRLGLISGSIAGIWVFVPYYTGIYQTTAGIFTGYLFYPVLFFCIFQAIKTVRNKESNGYIDIKVGLKTGLQVTGVSALTHAAFTYLFWLNPPADYIGYIVEVSEKIMTNANKKPEEIASELEKLRLNLKPFKQLTLTIFNVMLPGMFSSMIMAFLLRQGPTAQ